MLANSVVTFAAGVFLLLGVLGFWWGTRSGSVGQQHRILVFAWLCMALTAALVIFAVFPTSQANGTIFGVTLGGAGAFVMLIWTAALRATSRATQLDMLEAAVDERDSEIARLRDQLADGAARHEPHALDRVTRHLYQVDGAPARRLGIVTGDLRRVTGIDVWVNPENTAMQMARSDEYSVSGIIRYEGARRDDAGRIVVDTIADELHGRVRTSSVAPCTAIATGAGALGQSNGVRYVVHVAAVQGEPGAGFRQVREIGRCVTNALAIAGKLGDGQPVRSILFPLLGAGTGGGDLAGTAQVLIAAAVDHLATESTGTLDRILFLAYTDVELAACLAAIKADARLVAVS